MRSFVVARMGDVPPLESLRDLAALGGSMAATMTIAAAAAPAAERSAIAMLLGESETALLEKVPFALAAQARGRPPARSGGRAAVRRWIADLALGLPVARYWFTTRLRLQTDIPLNSGRASGAIDLMEGRLAGFGVVPGRPGEIERDGTILFSGCVVEEQGWAWLETVWGEWFWGPEGFPASAVAAE